MGIIINQLKAQLHVVTMQQLPTRIEAYANSFFPSTIKLWKNLSQNQVNATTVEEFAETPATSTNIATLNAKRVRVRI